MVYNLHYTLIRSDKSHFSLISHVARMLECLNDRKEFKWMENGNQSEIHKIIEIKSYHEAINEIIISYDFFILRLAKNNLKAFLFSMSITRNLCQLIRSFLLCKVKIGNVYEMKWCSYCPELGWNAFTWINVGQEQWCQPMQCNKRKKVSFFSFQTLQFLLLLL